MVPTPPIIRRMGLERPYAAMARTPRNRPMTMLSTSMHSDVVRTESTWAKSILLVSFLIIETKLLLFGRFPTPRVY